ncbi:hypothetical protein BJ912DRAFT_1040592 [Pholiota molesta]|nr:hypothetical protein BJ912DRAFT_1040592 [Pholiota molesta]
MANPNIAAEQLLELLLTLKKTTPEAARTILNNQPAIAYALMTLMVSMNAVNIEVFQKTLAEFGAANAPDTSSSAPSANALSGPTSANAPPAASAPISAIPPHLQAQYRTATPPSSSSAAAAAAAQAPTHTPTPPYGYSAAPNGGGYGVQGQGYGYQQQQQQGGYGQYPQYQQQPQQQQQAGGYTGYPGAGPALPDSLAGISDEQKGLIMRVLSMTPEQINMLPPADRATYIQIRATLGVPT